MNVQVLTDPFGQLLWASPALPCSTYDLTAARQHGIIAAVTDAGLKCWADTAYQGVGGPVRVPFRGRRLKRWKCRHNTTHAKIRCLGERAMSTNPGRPSGRHGRPAPLGDLKVLRSGDLTVPGPGAGRSPAPSRVRPERGSCRTEGRRDRTGPGPL
ncbi:MULTISPECIES: transposase family protein [unclassified Streptomyces]|uniref:transposase family protein n=1 Tax=unclassified Streptomyces TaxID=2593676 RepID=UPI003867D758